jgi:hypothetical protein
MQAAQAQPQWRFHLAFEDGSGAKDTLWFIYDTSATTGSVGNPVVDYDLGEGAVEMLPGTFNVFLINWDFDSTKTLAWPYTWYPYFETGNTIEAINWVPPMTLRWDTSLFHAPYLPYEQGSFGAALMDGLGFTDVSNGPGFGIFDMLIADSVTVSQFADFLFPFSVYFGQDSGLGLFEEQVPARVRPWPNPATANLYLGGHGVFSSVRVVDMAGRTVRYITDHPAATPIDIEALAVGRYIVQAMTEQGFQLNTSFVKHE